MNRNCTREVAVIGASGQLGTPLVAALRATSAWEVRPLGRPLLDLADTDGARLARVLDPVPDVVINTAFWPTEEPDSAFRVNAVGPRLLAEFCAARGALLVHLSTDYVFDGEAHEPYRETDRTEPRSVYGISKLAGEHLVRACGPRHLIVRVSSLYGQGGTRGKGGTSFPSVMLDKARRGERLHVVTDQIYSPTYAPDAAATIVDLLEAGVTGTVHVSNTGWCSRYEFASLLFRLTGLNPELVPVRMADLPPGPPAPRYSVLGHYALRAAGIPSPRPWQEGLGDFVQVCGAGEQSTG